MHDLLAKPTTAFQGTRLLASGALLEVALAVKAATDSGAAETILVFDDKSGRVIDLDLRGSSADISARLSQPAPAPAGRFRSRTAAEAAKEESTEPRGRGRPKLGVVAREVTLLPRQWEWLAEQPEGASAVLRKLVDEAKRNNSSQQRKAAQEATYQFMLAIAGDRPGYEEATRALFANDSVKLEQGIAEWPEDIKAHVLRLLSAADVHEAG
ncbi:Uncharacterized conserved protein [Janthinobacterium sp. Marseille]|nr:DUF2239 family protein [Janthinobacterium sp. Marseille]ABR90048.1 Uncharacterized conserved protein [Janthinobacterium sp. Marseille]